MNSLQILIGIVGMAKIAYATLLLYRRVRLMWRLHRFKKTETDYLRQIKEFFASQEIGDCEDCKHSEISKNNGNLLCLHERSSHFGQAVPPVEGKMFCYFERR